MTTKEKELLLKDLCARVPYHPKGKIVNAVFGEEWEEWLTCDTFTLFTNVLNNCRLYLRPMSSMTEEEEKEIREINSKFYKDGTYISAGVFGADDCGCTVFEMAEILNYLNSHHLDYRGLIEKGLAIDCTNLNIY